MNDALGDRMKSYEKRETGRTFLPMLPVYARIDGRSFSKFTKGMKRPWDDRMTEAMKAVTEYLVKETNAVVGYTQSDEISLVWLVEDHLSDMMFARKVQKLCSVLASMAASRFVYEVIKRFDMATVQKFPHFDCRILQLPNKTEAANMILWRYLDAKKNSVSMHCRHYYSAKQMHGKGQPEMLDMITEAALAKGDPDYPNLPEEFRTGTFFMRIEREMVREADEDGKAETYMRKFVVPTTIPDFHRAVNRTQIIFEGQNPMYEHVEVFA